MVAQDIIDAFILNPERMAAVAYECGFLPDLLNLLERPIFRLHCYHDINAFIEYCFVDPETNGPVEQQDFQKEWQCLIMENNRVLIAAPRGHGKSIQAIAFVIWSLGRNHDLRIKIIGASDEKAKEVLGLIRDMISKSDLVHDIFPDLLIDYDRGDTKGAFFVRRTIPQRDPSVEAAGVLSAGAGGRADILICDDVVDLKNSVINPAQREQVIRAVKETWFSLVAAHGKVVWICTPYHVMDATHDLKNNTGDLFKVWWTPAIVFHLIFDEDTGEPVIDPETGLQMVEKRILWGDKWTEKKLEEKRKEVGERVFARQYLLNAMSDEERTFTDAILMRSYEPLISNIGYMELDQEIPHDWPTYGGIDLASALGKKNAWTVITTLAQNPNNDRLYIKEIWRRRCTFPDIVYQIGIQFKAHQWRLCFVENNAFQQAVVEASAEDYKAIPVEGFTTGAYNKANELIGLPGLAVALEKGAFALPSAKFPLPMDDKSPLGVLMEELQSHPGGEFSDTVMALWFAWRASLRGGQNFEEAYWEAMASA